MTERRAHPRVWRTRLWVRIFAVIVPMAFASTLFYPQVLNTGWTDGMPASDLHWLFGFIGVTVVLAFCALFSRVTVDDDVIQIVNPWGTYELERASVVDVRPGPYGVEFVGAAGNKNVAFAVQCTNNLLGKTPRWVELARSVTGKEPDWRHSDRHD